MPDCRSFWLGLDFGTSGARAVAIDERDTVCAEAAVSYDLAQSALWHDALIAQIAALPVAIRAGLRGLAIDATSATMLLHDREGRALGEPLRYDDARATAEAALIAQIAPRDDVTASATSALAKTLWLTRQPFAARATGVLDQSAWLTAQLTGSYGVTDYHNALKLGCDMATLGYPAWMASLGIAPLLSPLLPRIVAPGTPLGTVKSALVTRLGLPENVQVVAGTTDSIAAFMAAGITRPGQAVTSLGSTLVLKLLSDRRVTSADFGVYSHRYGSRWLAGGASNTGGAVLRHFFDDATLVGLSARIDPTRASGFDYYPLLRAGERFPVNAPAMVPRMVPRPPDDMHFLHGLLEGIARIEARGYALLGELGANPLVEVFTAGGGASNPCWQAMRERLLGVPVRVATHTQAAYGAALLARHGTALLDR